MKLWLVVSGGGKFMSGHGWSHDLVMPASNIYIYYTSLLFEMILQLHCKLLLFLKIVPVMILLVSFVYKSKKSTCETRKNDFYFTSNDLLVFKIIKFNFSDIKISNAPA